MKVAYFDCFCGISGDMALGAFLDAGVEVDDLRFQLQKMPLSNWHLEAESVVRRGVRAVSVTVLADDKHPKRGLCEIRQIIEHSGLSNSVKSNSLAIFSRLAEVEAKIHASSVDEVHFHELGAVDTIVDIVGVCVCMELLGVVHVYASPIPTFHGSVETRHGVLPLPAPATLELLKDAPWRELGIEGEIVTPTGAAILAVLAKSYGSMPAMKVTSVGWGAGKRDLEIPNVLRLIIGEEVGEDRPAHIVRDNGSSVCSESDPCSGQVETIAILETNIDDMSPQLYDMLFERLFNEGALDVFLTPIQMKKTRPAVLVSIMCEPQLVDHLSNVLFEETSTLGVRIDYKQRVCLPREFVTVNTRFGPIRVKVARKNGQLVNVQPEYDECRIVAEAHGVPVKLVQSTAIASFFNMEESASGES
ncbi:MAG: nickel pincer cofactor biosynthesis protein LarC [Armatimonadota bacterium]